MLFGGYVQTRPQEGVFFGKKSDGMLYGQKIRTPHLMQICLVIVRWGEVGKAR